MPDKRRLLRAKPPEAVGRAGQFISVHLDEDTYASLYWMAFDAGRSLSDQVRAIIRERTE